MRGRPRKSAPATISVTAFPSLQDRPSDDSESEGPGSLASRAGSNESNADSAVSESPSQTTPVGPIIKFTAARGRPRLQDVAPVTSNTILAPRPRGRPRKSAAAVISAPPLVQDPLSAVNTPHHGSRACLQGCDHALILNQSNPQVDGLGISRSHKRARPSPVVLPHSARFAASAARPAASGWRRQMAPRISVEIDSDDEELSGPRNAVPHMAPTTRWLPSTALMPLSLISAAAIEALLSTERMHALCLIYGKQNEIAKFMKLARATKEHAAALNQAPLPADLLRAADMSTWSFQIELSITRAHDPKTAGDLLALAIPWVIHGATDELEDDRALQIVTAAALVFQKLETALRVSFPDGSPTSLVAVQRVTQIILRFFRYRATVTTFLLRRSASDPFYAEGIAIATAFANIAASVRPFIEAAQASIISAGESQEGTSAISANKFIASAFALLLRPALRALTLPLSSSSVAAVVSAADLGSSSQELQTALKAPDVAKSSSTSPSHSSLGC